MKKKINFNFVLISLHLILGVLLIYWEFSSKIISLAVFFFGIIHIIKTSNKKNEAIFWCAYVVGSEVLFRMSGGTLFYELPKYSVLLFLLLGLYIEEKSHHISISYLIYILLLLIGISFTNIPFNESIRKAIAFNLSGPILLGVSSIYFYKRKLSISTVLNILKLMFLPILSILVVLFLSTPSLESIIFSSNANFTTSGGYGPNQVSTILGLGVFIMVAFLLFKKRLFLFFTIDALVCLYVIYRGILTFSRGGMITAFLSILVFIFFFVLGSKNKLEHFVKYASAIGLIIITLGFYTSYKTEGMVVNRYTNKNTAGIEKKDISTGRIELFKTELEAFFDNPFFGIGVGGSKFYRADKLEKMAASHSELSRLLSEHGFIGLISLILLLVVPIFHILKQTNLARGLLGAFLAFWFLTINHSAMRIAFPGFIYGLSVCIIVFENKNNEENSLHRE